MTTYERLTILERLYAKTLKTDNPHHLFLGTKGDNIHDMDRKGRRVNAQPRGEASGSAKLTEKDIRLIRARYANGEWRRHIAVEFGITPEYVWEIAKRKTWAHVS